MTLENYLSKLEEEKEILRSGEATDLQDLMECQGAMNQRFTVVIFGMNAVNATRGDVIFARQLFDPDGYEIDDAVAVEIAVDSLEGQVEMYRNRFNLGVTAGLLVELIDYIYTTDNHKSIDEVLKSFQEYMSFLQYQIGLLLPFHDLGVAFEGRHHVESGS